MIDKHLIPKRTIEITQTEYTELRNKVESLIQQKKQLKLELKSMMELNLAPDTPETTQKKEASSKRGRSGKPTSEK